MKAYRQLKRNNLIEDDSGVLTARRLRVERSSGGSEAGHLLPYFGTSTRHSSTSFTRCSLYLYLSLLIGSSLQHQHLHLTLSRSWLLKNPYCAVLPNYYSSSKKFNTQKNGCANQPNWLLLWKYNISVCSSNGACGDI